MNISLYDAGQAALDTARCLPPECDVPIRANRFWQPDDLHTLTSRDHLLTIRYHSVGLGAGLLLSVPPDRRGRIDDAEHHGFEPVTVRELQIRLTGGNQALAAVNGFHCGHSATPAPPTYGQAAPASAKPD
ncbi:hypothetical protein ACWCP8_24250 [Streptomyces sp. NPDC002206]